MCIHNIKLSVCIFIEFTQIYISTLKLWRDKYDWKPPGAKTFEHLNANIFAVKLNRTIQWPNLNTTVQCKSINKIHL